LHFGNLSSHRVSHTSYSLDIGRSSDLHRISWIAGISGISSWVPFRRRPILKRYTDWVEGSITAPSARHSWASTIKCTQLYQTIGFGKPMDAFASCACYGRGGNPS